MTAKFYAILTNQGAARLANAAALGTKLNLTQMAVGDANGTLPAPDPAQTKLLNQKRIAPLNRLSIDPDNASQIIAEQVIPENEGGFWIRELGLFDDSGALIAVANCPETYKPLLQEGSGRTQTIRMVLIVSSTAAVTLKIDPAVVLATRQYVDEKVIEVKAYADDLMKKHIAADNPHAQYLQAKNNLSDVADKAKGRSALGLGSAALKNTGTSGDAVPLANGANTWSAKQTFSGGAEGSLSGNATTASKLQAARKIGGVAFDGSADITLPGVNAAGNQATSGNAATATKLQTTRSLWGNNFDGTTSIDGTITIKGSDVDNTFFKLIHGDSSTDGGYVAVGNNGKDRGYVELGTTDDAITSIYARKRDAKNTVISTVTILDESNNTIFPGTVKALKFDGNAATATRLTTTRNIGGASFDGTADISVDTLRQNLNLGEGSALPVGVPVPWPTATPPAGWLICNGATFDKAKYPKLALAYPTGKLPDLRGEFIRGWDNGRGVDIDRQLLSWQDATSLTDYHGDGSFNNNGNSAPPQNYFKNYDKKDYAGASFTAFGTFSGKAETQTVDGITNYLSVRSRNIAFNYIVRAA
ncbi:phage tail protein [uncultured Pluralibacter sp.]|uniref:phage tail-collar fiber domain-containing protein n=1 Tax=uncultured Pluralibacter sp. TaxID=1490864 RepID=UPI00260ADDEB|nr:phage tail protein [uncultured Pluralibacter sp.]